MTQGSGERNARLEGAMRAILAELLFTEVKDPRLEGVTVSGVRLSADRSHARVYFSLFGDPERERQAGDGFSAATSFMRRELGRRMRLRVVPSLTFLRDPSYEYGDRMERLFDRLESEGYLGTDESPEGDGGEQP